MRRIMQIPCLELVELVHDEHGDFIVAASWFIPHVRDVNAAELQAIRNGMYLLASLGYNRAEVESDSSFAVDSVQLMDDCLGSEATIVAECKQLSIDFTKINFKHCYREANQVAGALAKHSFSSKLHGSWDAEIPDFISHLFVNNMTII